MLRSTSRGAVSRIERCLPLIAASMLASVLSFLTSTAHAEDYYTRRSFLAKDGGFEITGEPSRPEILRADISDDGPHAITLPPHFYFGVSRDVTLGITHRRGLCLSACGDRHYNDVGFGLLVGLARGADYEIDLNTGLQFRSIDPAHFGWKGGVIGRVNFGQIVGFVFDPTLYLAFTGRDTGNQHQLVLPFWFYFQASPKVAPFVGAMLVGPLDGFIDNLSIPVEGGVMFSVSDRVDLGFDLRFTNLLGHHGGPAGRELGLLGRFQF
ncbi:MAG TPA: hypothetical protein VFQ61_25590 [Polyangiaceae bacterium]|nr:hypothetical protein [Polyangiaceae bacterium]